MTSQHMTDDPLSLGTQYGLGTHRATYKVPTMSQDSVNYIICLIIFTICIIGIGLLVRSHSVSVDFHTSSANLSFFIVFLLGSLALVILVGVLENVYHVIRYGTLGLFLYDDGFIYGTQTSRQAVSWQNVQAVWHKVIVSSGGYVTTSRDVYTINCTDGTKITIGKLYQFKNMVQIGHVIETETARYLFPAALNRYRMGQPVVFGPLTVTREGLSHRSQRLPWTRIKRRRILSNEISESRLVIREPGKRFAWASINLDAPQVEVFWMLVDHMREVSLSGV